MRRAGRGAPDRPKSAGPIAGRAGRRAARRLCRGLRSTAAVMPVKDWGAGAGMGQARRLYATA